MFGDYSCGILRRGSRICRFRLGFSAKTISTGESAARARPRRPIGGEASKYFPIAPSHGEIITRRSPWKGISSWFELWLIWVWTPMELVSRAKSIYQERRNEEYICMYIRLRVVEVNRGGESKYMQSFCSAHFSFPFHSCYKVSLDPAFFIFILLLLKGFGDTSCFCYMFCVLHALLEMHRIQPTTLIYPLW